MRKAFSMITAIFIIIIMATIAMFVMSLSGKGVKATTAQYQRAQAMLYAKSYTEFAIMAVTGHNRIANCVEDINGNIGNINQGGYEIRTHIAYIGPISEIGNCRPDQQLSTNVTTPETPLTIIVDAYVDYEDPDNTGAPKVTVHRRTVQKI
ncbi:hypothetical protein [Sulfurovum sp. NBC37-1]|uniref:hypothetical protein n=1 Tax=Sulfurovum sp. (strain NBC37-1) TaxID=387093 RepID=UPI0001587C59|nr:hypothetical protein [Sulfurovum sp. NBC37-1]BAF72858.1 conserved hypothetical protein [Sulfurovum sp. NBC37-1]